MQAYQLELSKRGVEAIEQAQPPMPEMHAGQVRIRLHAWSLNYRDLLIVNGLYPVATGAQRLIPVCDGAGEIVEVGQGVTRFAKGDRVVASFRVGSTAR